MGVLWPTYLKRGLSFIPDQDGRVVADVRVLDHDGQRVAVDLACRARRGEAEDEEEEGKVEGEARASSRGWGGASRRRKSGRAARESESAALRARARHVVDGEVEVVRAAERVRRVAGLVAHARARVGVGLAHNQVRA